MSARYGADSHVCAIHHVVYSGRVALFRPPRPRPCKCHRPCSSIHVLDLPSGALPSSMAPQQQNRHDASGRSIISKPSSLSSSLRKLASCCAADLPVAEVADAPGLADVPEAASAAAAADSRRAADGGGRGWPLSVSEGNPTRANSAARSPWCSALTRRIQSRKSGSSRKTND